MSSDSIPSRLFRQQRIRPSEPAYREKRNGSWRTTSWHEYAEQVKRAGKALIALGLKPNKERGQEGVPTVCILGFNRPEVPTRLFSSPDDARAWLRSVPE